MANPEVRVVNMYVCILLAFKGRGRSDFLCGASGMNFNGSWIEQSTRYPSPDKGDF